MKTYLCRLMEGDMEKTDFREHINARDEHSAYRKYEKWLKSYGVSMNGRHIEVEEA